MLSNGDYRLDVMLFEHLVIVSCLLGFAWSQNLCHAENRASNLTV